MVENQLNLDVAAFVDGELDPHQRLRLLEAMANDPQLVRQAIHLQQLRISVHRALQGSPAAPDQLRLAVERLAETPPKPLANTPVASYRISRWRMPSAAAAVIILALILAAGIYSPWPGSGTTYATAIAPETVQNLSRRHNGCTKQKERLFNTGRFPKQVQQVPAAIAEHLGRAPYANLDFSALGYRFFGVGECRSPGNESVHLVYLADGDDTSTDGLSLWIHLDRSQFDIHAAQFYTANGSRNAMLFWRHNGLMYYLMGDSADSVARAHDLLVDG